MWSIQERIFTIDETRTIPLQLKVSISTGAIIFLILARRSRRFPRKLETLYAVVEVFVAAYNRFGIAKYNYRLHHPKGDITFALVDFF